MKKIALFFLVALFSLGMAACNNVPEDVDECIEDPTLPQCQICEDGYELQGTECVPVDEPLECEDNEQVINGECVEIVVKTPEEILVDFIVDECNQNGDLTFLSAAFEAMDFSEAMTVTTDVNFNITADGETNYFEGTIVDAYIMDEVNGDMMKRHIILDVNSEFQLDFEVIYHEVATGVHVYIAPESLLAALTEDNPEALMVLNWIGLNEDWIVFEFDDSLEQIIQIEVLKDMMVSLFFSEFGESVFTDFQEDELEVQIGFDLNQYGFDLGAMMDELIEEDFDSLELLIDGIDVEGIQLHIDHLHFAWRLEELVREVEAELLAAGFDVSKIDLLHTAVYDENTEMATLINDPIDRTLGTIAFFESITEQEIGDIIEEVVKPLLEEELYNSLQRDFNPDNLAEDFRAVLVEEELFLVENWTEGVTYDPVAELALYDSLGPVAYWMQLTEEQRSIIHWAIDDGNDAWIVHELRNFAEEDDHYRWYYTRWEHEVDILNLNNELMNFINGNVQAITDNTDFDGVQIQEDMNMYDEAYRWFFDADPYLREELFDVVNLPGNEGYVDVYNELFHLANEGWSYNWYYRNWEGHYIHPDWVDDVLMDLIESHTNYLEDEYSINPADYINGISAQGGIDWFMGLDEFDREVIIEISMFFGEHNEHYWVVDELVRAMEQGGYFWWFGRQEERYDIEYIDYEVAEFIEYNYGYALGLGIDPDQWITDIYDYGAMEWYNMLSENDQGLFADLHEANQYSWNSWSVEVFLSVVTGEGEYSMCYGDWQHCMDPEMMTEILVNLIDDYDFYFLAEGYDVPALIAEIEMYGALDWYRFHADMQDIEILDMIHEEAHRPYELMWTIEDIIESEDELIEFLTSHETALNDAGLDATGWLAYLEANGLQDFVENELTVADIELILETLVYIEIEDLLQAIEDEELLEYLMDRIWGDPHVTELLTMINDDPEIELPIDTMIIAQNMMAIDFDALVNESVDFEAFVEAIYNGPTDYEAFIVANEGDAPNLSLILELFGPGVEMLQPYMIYVDDALYAVDGLMVFEQFIDPAYYMDDIFDVEVVATENVEVLMIMEMDGIAYAQIFDDLTEQLGIYLAGFQTLPFPYDDEWNCMELNCEEPEFNQILAQLTQVGMTEMHMLMDPSDPTWMEMGLDFTDFVNYLFSFDGMEPPVANDVSITITMQDNADIQLPDDPLEIAVANDVADDLARFAMTKEAFDILEDFAYYYEMSPTELVPLVGTQVALADIEFLRFSQAFNLENSYIEVTATDFEIYLEWIDGAPVFNNPVALSDLLPLWLDGNLQSAAGYEFMVDQIDDSTWSVTRLFLYYMFQDDYNEYDEGMYN